MITIQKKWNYLVLLLVAVVCWSGVCSASQNAAFQADFQSRIPHLASEYHSLSFIFFFLILIVLIIILMIILFLLSH